MAKMQILKFSRAVLRRITTKQSLLQLCASDSSFVFKTSTRNFSCGSHVSLDSPYIPRRTLMYVPGHDPKKLKKIPALGVDCAVLECEDGVALNMKAQARKNIRDALEYLEAQNLDLALRINSRFSGLMEADLEAVIGDALGPAAAIEKLPQTILLPKVDTVEDLLIFTEHLKSVKLGRNYCPYLVTYVESAQGLMNFKDILKKAADFSQEGHFHLDGAVFGSDDFVADIGAERTPDAKELIYARQKFVMVAKAFRIQAIDMVYVDIHNTDGLRIQADEGAKMGFTGKQIIHPVQVPHVKAAFTPSPARVEWATELVKNFEDHQKSGQVTTIKTLVGQNMI
ncbi:citrate lyase subunit beta-like protein, mitochondrial [Elysia marginata]|uniref:Citrate lyase subunit beta-like protein, mitochondrial n=1 Tax=Elysia marginata TaxID=1093978 RepID=A0AAV4EKH0_9GAST|nr:citrate lyase subunit beta-like protein, mitochondrial [Elysia marginata]